MINKEMGTIIISMIASYIVTKVCDIFVKQQTEKLNKTKG